MATHTARLTLTYTDEQAPTPGQFSLDGPIALNRLASHIQALAAGHREGSLVIGTDDGDGEAATGTFSCSGTSHGVKATGSVTLTGVGGTAASGTVTLSGVGGTAASGTVTLAGGAGDVTVTINGESVGPVPFNTDDATTASDVAAAINAEGDFGGLLFAAVALDEVVTITAFANGAAGNVSLSASRTSGSATASGPTLTGGEDGNVTVVLNGTSVGPVDVTDDTDAAAATAVAAALEANGTLGPIMTAVGNGADVEITWGTKGTVGNAVTLTSSSNTGTATASGATLEGGAQGSVGVTINGTLVTTNTTTLSDSAAATAVAAALNANSTVAALVTATANGTKVDLEADTAGTAGNAITLSSTSATGTAVASGATLSGGTDTSVTATINGVGIVANTTTTTTDAQVATAVQAAIAASNNPLVDGVVTATVNNTTVTITADEVGAHGNWITIAATGTGFTASGARLTGGSDDTTTVTFSR